jgi:VWFA-related protein
MSPARIALLLSLLPATALLPAQSPPPTQPPDATPSIPTIRVTSRIVELDVVVSDSHNHPGVGLNQSDFTLTEDGVPQTIDSFTERDSPPLNHIPEPQLPPNTFTVQPPVTGNGVMTVIVLSNFGPFIRDQLKSYFQTSNLTTPIAIFRMDWEGMHLVQGFTTQRSVLLDAANSQRIWPPLGPRFHADPASFRVGALGAPTQHLAAYLAGIPGRINLIWIGGGAPIGQAASAFSDESSSFTAEDSNSLASVTQMVGNLNRSTDIRRLGRVALYSILTGNSCLAFQTNEVVERVNAAGGRGFRCTDPKPAMEQIAATGLHYYSISYRPTNPDWNGAYRKIHLDVAGYAQPPFTLRWSQLITGWADDVEPTLLYRHGYFARATPPPQSSSVNFGAAPPPNSTADLSDSAAARARLAPQRRLISISTRGAFSAAMTRQIQAATAFASLTPSQIHFTIVAAAQPAQQKLKAHDILPPDNYLTDPFREGPYRNYRIHYWIDPQNLHFVQNNATGIYHDDLKIILVVYRDDGVAANSFATTTTLDLAPAELEAVQSSGVTLDQTIAVPVYDNFFLRAVVSENSSNQIGALEVPAEWVH